MSYKEFYLGGNRVGSSLLPYKRLLEPVKWLIWNSGRNGVTFIPGMTEEAYNYNTVTRVITAVGNIGLPSFPKIGVTIVSPGDTLGFDPLTIDGSKLVCGPNTVTDTPAVGDRVAWIDTNWWGLSGVYEIVDAGEQGVRPYRLVRSQDLFVDEDFSVYSVTILKDKTDTLRPCATITFAPGNHWWTEVGLELGTANLALATNASAVAGNRATAIGFGVEAFGNASMAIGGGHVVKDPGLVGIAGSGTWQDPDNFGAFVRKRVKNIDPALATYTFARIDEGSVCRSTRTSTQTIIIPTSGTVDQWYEGAQLEVVQSGTGAVTIQGAGSVTVTGGASTNGAGSRLIAICTSLDTWQVTCIPAPSSLLGAGSPLTVLSSGAAPLGSVPVADGGGGIGWDTLPGGGSPPWSVYDESALVISDNVETNLVLQAIPAATLSTNGSSVKFDIVSLLLNNTGANQVITPRLKLGGTTVYADASGDIATSTATRACKFVGNIIRVSATTARISATLIIGGAQGATTGGGDFGSSALRVCPVYSILATVDWSAPVEFICSVQLGATAANFTLTRQFFAMER